jgi:hypothetical protein
MLNERSSSVWDNELRIDISRSFQVFYLFPYSGFGRFLSVKFYILWFHNVSCVVELRLMILLSRIYYDFSYKRVIFQLFVYYS